VCMFTVGDDKPRQACIVGSCNGYIRVGHISGPPRNTVSWLRVSGQGWGAQVRRLVVCEIPIFIIIFVFYLSKQIK